MKKVFLGMALAISVSMAEKSGAFLGGGFQYSNLENQNTTRTPDANNNTPIDTSMFGNNQTAPAQERRALPKRTLKSIQVHLDEKIREQVMKKSFKKLGFVSLATSSVLLGSMNATDLETYATLQKPSHVFSNYAEKDSGSGGTTHTASSGTPAPSTPSASDVASQLVKDTTTVNNLKSVSVSGMNTTLSGVTTIS
ncbi:hypothetical protein HpHA70_03730 [Helicobacter pylori]